MNPIDLEPKKWYWVQKSNGTIVPYRLNRVIVDQDPDGGMNANASSMEGDEKPETTVNEGRRICRTKVEMFVGSMIQTFSPSQIIGLAEMPTQ